MSESTKVLGDFNPFDPAVLESPFEFNRMLVSDAPVYRDPNTNLVLVSSYDLVHEALKRHEDFSNRFGQAMAGKAVQDEELRVADDLIAGFIQDGRFSVLRQFCVPLPLSVIADQLGVPSEDLPQFKRWTDGFVAQLGGMASKEEQVEAARLIVEYQHYFAERLAEAKAAPRDDIISDLVRARLEGERALNTAESLSIIQQLLVAGNETTASTIAAGLLLLIQHPDQMKLVCEDPGLLPNMIEEVTRLTTPTQNMWRVATNDCELGDFKVNKGDFVFIRYGAANRDPARFEDPDRFDVLRENAAEHLAYGHGIHFCIGAMLARKEMLVSFRTLLARLGDLKIADGQAISHKPNMLLRGLKDFEIEFRAV